MTCPFTSRAGRPGLGPYLLGGLLLLATIPGCKGEDPNSYENMKKKQGDAVAALEQAGGKVVEKRYPMGTAHSVTLKGAQITDGTFAHLQQLGRISELDLSKSTITDDQLAKVNEVGGLLVQLNLSGTAVTDSGLDKLTKLSFINRLDLTGTKVTAAGVERFRKNHQSHPKVLNQNPQILR